ncbi:hypothetical protein QF037_009954 [Streptomyces canus]|uniref:hypothetical protein n=1 Tax=Streptomyces canus TaxID=58343 RepID=UPI0027853487|nr:hypothetical protein [Streptomyces canus]MDQ0605521.1 hypothetical protein [Streptomyces canus]
MYSLTPGYRIPGLQRGLSPAETLLTKANVLGGSAVLMSAVVAPPPIGAFGAVAATAALLNIAPGPRSLARWAAVGYRRLRERTPPASMTGQPGSTATWILYPDHGTMQDPQRREAWHAALSRALTHTGGQARSAGIQVHTTHHAQVGEHTVHTQTISVHVPKGLAGQPDRILDTLEGEFGRLGYLAPADPDPAPTVVERGPGWVRLDDDRYAATARITSWPDVTDGDLMTSVLIGTPGKQVPGSFWGYERSFAVLYRPLPAAQSRRSARWQDAAGGAFTTDRITSARHEMAADTTHGALVEGDSLVDVDAYMTVWGDSPGAVADAHWQASLVTDQYRIRLDWLTGQQHRAHVMTTPHGASTRKGAVL